MLVVDDPRYFDDDTRSRLRAFLDERVLFAPELLALADRAAAERGLPPDAADELLRRATAAFALSSIPVDRAWYDHLDAISSVAADIGGVPTTHLNHLTPRVLDIDALQARMRARGVEMIDEIQGPPAWEGPDVLLRQTSFRALAEERVFRYPDGSVRTGALRVRFGEVEQRGIALTPRGRALYDRMVAEADVLGGGADGAREVWRRHLPATERGLAEHGLAFFTYRVAGPAQARARERVRAGGHGCDRAGADRLRGLPAPLGGRDLPLQPRRRGHPRRGPHGAGVRPRAAGRGARRRPCTTPWTSTPRSRTRRCAPRRRSWASGSSPAVPTSTTSRGA